MSFVEPQLVNGRWVEVSGPAGTEWIEADLVGQVEQYSGPAIPMPDALEPYCENRQATEIKIGEGWGGTILGSGLPRFHALDGILVRAGSPAIPQRAGRRGVKDHLNRGGVQ